jgi:hypothetical protein
MKHVARLLREPLFHFLVIGGLAFLLFAAVSEPRPAPLETILIGPERVAQLAQGFEAVWRRPPTDDEMRAIVDDFVREEVYYREALTLGLDRDDAVVRRRLRQKMEFLTDTGADLLRPGPGELEAHLAANAPAFRRGPRLAFEQVYLGERPDPAMIAAALSALRSDPMADPDALGERTVLPAQLSLSPPEAVDGVFGGGFFERLAELPAGAWAGPVESAYGVHVVRIAENVPARMPAMEEVQDAVLRDWKEAKALELRERLFARLRDRYVVEIRGADVGAGERQ